MSLIIPDYARNSDTVSRSITAENPNGEKGFGGQAASRLGPGRKGSPCIDLRVGTTTIADIDGPGVIRHIWFTLPRTSGGDPFVLRNLVLRITWDDAGDPAVEVPIGDFFGCGFGERVTYSSAVMAVAPTGGMNCYLAMPFRKRAVIEIVNEHPNDVGGFFYQVDYSLGDEILEEDMYLHAVWSRSDGTTELGEDHVIAEVSGAPGAYVGTQIFLAQLGRFWYGEGEVKFFIDGDGDYATIVGTGLEDYVGGAWGFQDKMGGESDPQALNFDYLYSGYHQQILSSRLPEMPYVADIPPCHGMYRWHLPDPIRFASDLRVTLQQIGDRGGHLFERSDDITTVAYWYQATPEGLSARLAEQGKRVPR